MKTIYKYPLEFLPEQTIEMSIGFQILDIQKQHAVPCIWALVDNDNIPLYVKIYIYGTGEEIKQTDLNYIGTYQSAEGNLVFHVFYKIL